MQRRDVKTLFLALSVVLMILVLGRMGHAGSGSYIDYPHAEYRGHVLTDLGTWAIYQSKWNVLHREWKSRNPGSSLIVTAFSDRNKWEIWYSEDILDRLLGRFGWWMTPLEAELGNVSSMENWNKAVLGDIADEQSIKRIFQERRFDLKGKAIH